MAFYIGKQVEAWQFGSGPIPGWIPIEDETGDGTIKVYTKRGYKPLFDGDWVVKISDGTIKVMSDTKFKSRYDALYANKPAPKDYKNSYADGVGQITQPQADMRDKGPVPDQYRGDRLHPDPNKGVFRTPEAIQQNIDQRASAARPTVNKHKPSEYND